MTDRSWMLNPTAIACAKRCILAVEKELDIKLKLSHPQFLSMVGEYAELTSEQELQSAYIELATLAGVNVNAAPTMEAPAAPASTQNADQTITYRGKDYPRFNKSGEEFQGLYRGQARYA
jgi:hypothetical protein